MVGPEPNFYGRRIIRRFFALEHLQVLVWQPIQNSIFLAEEFLVLILAWPPEGGQKLTN